jgi:alginate export protein
VATAFIVPIVHASAADETVSVKLPVRAGEGPVAEAQSGRGESDSTMSGGSSGGMEPAENGEVSSNQPAAASTSGAVGNRAWRFSPAGELNERLPAWLRFDAEYGARLEYGFSGKQFAPGSQDGYFLNRIRFGVSIQPASWLKFHGEAQDSRAFGKRPPPTSQFYDLLDVRQAYVQVGDPAEGPWSLVIGRQTIYLGGGRLVADRRWIFPGRTFDAARLTLRHNGYRLDGFAASVVQITSLNSPGFSDWHFGNDIYGLYGGIEKLVPGVVIEPYVFWRAGKPITADTQGLTHRDFQVYGFRWNGKLPKGFDYATEIAVERGKVGKSDFEAWAGHWVLGRTLKSAWRPRLFAEYNYASGDKNAEDTKVQTFDVMYPSAHLKWGETDQVGWRNIHDVRGGLELSPSPWWSVSGNYHAYWLANTHDALYAANGLPVLPRVASGTAGRWVGQEADVQGSHKFAGAFEVGAGVGHIFPGTFIQRASPGRGYTFPYIMMIYVF